MADKLECTDKDNHIRGPLQTIIVWSWYNLIIIIIIIIIFIIIITTAANNMLFMWQFKSHIEKLSNSRRITKTAMQGREKVALNQKR